MMHTVKAWLWCLISAVGLGLAQPLFMPTLFGPVGHFQWLLGALVLVGYVPLWWAVADKNLKTTFCMSFVTLTLQYTIVLYWIYIACHDYGDIAAFSSAAITVLLPMEIAFVGAIFLTWGRLMSMKWPCSYFWVAPFALSAMEYFRNYLPFGGFPWGNSGYAVGRIPELLQLASVVGVYGLVFFVGLVNALIASALKTAPLKRVLLKLCLPLFLLALVYGFGRWRLSNDGYEYGPSVRVALLQGNIPQDMKSRPRAYANEIIEIYRTLHREALGEGAELVIWPEAAHPKTFEKNTQDLSFAPEAQVASVVGATSYGYDEDSESAHYHNSAFLQDYDGKVVSRYDKSHLVPFGEYVPWPLVGVVNKIVPQLGAYRPGVLINPVLLSLSPTRRVAIGATVCYEGIFPEISRAYAKNGATLLVNLTNDAWYGESSAPYQHLLMYQLRSVETGLPYVRATNSGISACIDAYGRIRKQSGLFERQILLDTIPLVSKATIYTKIGDVVAQACVGLLVLLSGVLIYQRALRRKNTQTSKDRPSHEH